MYFRFIEAAVNCIKCCSFYYNIFIFTSTIFLWRNLTIIVNNLSCMLCLIINIRFYNFNALSTVYCYIFIFISIFYRRSKCYIVLVSLAQPEINQVFNRHCTLRSLTCSPIISNHITIIDAVNYLFVFNGEALW